jgi:hypothetical protein
MFSPVSPRHYYCSSCSSQKEEQWPQFQLVQFGHADNNYTYNLDAMLWRGMSIRKLEVIVVSLSKFTKLPTKVFTKTKGKRSFLA